MKSMKGNCIYMLEIDSTFIKITKMKKLLTLLLPRIGKLILCSKISGDK